MALLRWIVGFFFTICIAGFAALNRSDVTILISPVHEEMIVPAYAVALGGVFVGFLFGAIMMWLNMGPVRKAKRKQKKEIKLLEREVERLKEERAFSAKPPAQDMFPALPASQS